MLIGSLSSLSSRLSSPSAQVETQSRDTTKQTHRAQETRVESCKSAFTHAAHARRVKLFSTTTPTTSLWDSPWPASGPGGLARPQGACFPPPGVNQIPFRKDLVATAKSASGYFSGESMVAESSQGTGFLLKGPSARSAANHRKIPRNFRESCQRRWSNRHVSPK